MTGMDDGAVADRSPRQRMHVVIFPWLAFGHLLPGMELAQRLASRGHRVSFVSTPRNLARLPRLPPALAPRVHLVALPLPRVDGLPDGAESTNDVPYDAFELHRKASDGLAAPFSAFLDAACANDGDDRPDWVVVDSFQHWAAAAAFDRKVPCAMLLPVAASILSHSQHAGDGQPQPVAAPRFETERKKIKIATESASGISIAQRFSLTLQYCSLVAMRTCIELEPEALTRFPTLFGKPVVPLGLLPPSPDGSRAAAGTESSNDAIMSWLDAHPAETVVYVALGSEAPLSTELVHELALGLELAGAPFLWAMRKPAGVLHADALPPGFEERTRGRGLVATGWVPQLSVLAHAAVGAFLTHCGWSSTIEGLLFGRPLIMLPIYGDQGDNARLMEGRRVGVQVARDEDDGSFDRHGVERAVRAVMLEDERRRVFVGNAKKLQQIVADKTCQERCIDEFVERLRSCSGLQLQSLFHRFFLIVLSSFRLPLAMAAADDSTMHIVIFPWLAFGHLLPCQELAERLAARGHRVSFVSTPRNLERLPPVRPALVRHIELVSLPLPRIDSLPDGAESTRDVPFDKSELHRKAFDGLAAPFAAFLDAEADGGRKPDWIVADFIHHWVAAAAEDRKVPCAMLMPCAAGVAASAGQPGVTHEEQREAIDQSTRAVPAFEARQAIEAFATEGSSGPSIIRRFVQTLTRSRFVAIRSCPDLEPDAFSLLARLYGKPAIPLGLLPPPPNGTRGVIEGAEGGAIMRWLDAQPAKSVVYVALGTEAPLRVELLRELAHGLELAGTRFLWALRPPVGDREDDIVVPDGFAERTGDRGLVTKQWVPQVSVLAHAAVGAFLTHCGWGSIVEGLQFGHPMIMLPIFGDQGPNARFMVGRKVGVLVARNEDDGSFDRHGVAGAVRAVAVEDERRVFATNARELQDIVADRACQERCIDGFIQHLRCCRG
ncbi:hypothetical protein U9M48_010251 [Paspalum notatum var. saurae]|uniref:UDP-glycosyltransferases domain-containing protein n=1 Tax=Paspalum notatum var. saurae TaxID=547442 RepID=A0AAQ3STT7_PASNO